MKKQVDDIFTSEKPEWDVVRWPWAVFLAQDADGAWHWFEREPQAGASRWRDAEGGRFCLAEYPDDLPHLAWVSSLERRPT